MMKIGSRPSFYGKLELETVPGRNYSLWWIQRKVDTHGWTGWSVEGFFFKNLFFQYPWLKWWVWIQLLKPVYIKVSLGTLTDVRCQGTSGVGMAREPKYEKWTTGFSDDNRSIHALCAQLPLWKGKTSRVSLSGRGGSSTEMLPTAATTCTQCVTRVFLEKCTLFWIHRHVFSGRKIPSLLCRTLPLLGASVSLLL